MGDFQPLCDVQLLPMLLPPPTPMQRFVSHPFMRVVRAFIIVTCAILLLATSIGAMWVALLSPRPGSDATVFLFADFPLLVHLPLHALMLDQSLQRKIGAVTAKRRAAYKAHPQQPWLWEPTWTARRAISSNGEARAEYKRACVGTFFHLLFVCVGRGIAMVLQDPSRPVTYIWFVICAAYLCTASVWHSVKFLRFRTKRDVLLKLDDNPIMMGVNIRGQIGIPNGARNMVAPTNSIMIQLQVHHIGHVAEDIVVGETVYAQPGTITTAATLDSPEEDIDIISAGSHNDAIATINLPIFPDTPAAVAFFTGQSNAPPLRPTACYTRGRHGRHRDVVLVAWVLEVAVPDMDLKERFTLPVFRGSAHTMRQVAANLDPSIEVLPNSNTGSNARPSQQQYRQVWESLTHMQWSKALLQLEMPSMNTAWAANRISGGGVDGEGDGHGGRRHRRHRHHHMDHDQQHQNERRRRRRTRQQEQQDEEEEEDEDDHGNLNGAAMGARRSRKDSSSEEEQRQSADEYDPANQSHHSNEEDVDVEQAVCAICLDGYTTMKDENEQEGGWEGEGRGGESSNSNSNMQVTLLPCQHYFHAACMRTWLRKKLECPMCKRDLRGGGRLDVDVSDVQIV